MRVRLSPVRQMHSAATQERTKLIQTRNHQLHSLRITIRSDSTLLQILEISTEEESQDLVEHPKMTHCASGLAINSIILPSFFLPTEGQGQLFLLSFSSSSPTFSFFRLLPMANGEDFVQQTKTSIVCLQKKHVGMVHDGETLAAE